MNVLCEVLEELTESFVGKRGPKTIPLWVCLDRSPGKPLRNTFDYEVSEEEHETLSGKVVGKTIELSISDIRLGFGGRARFKGQVQRVVAKELES